MWLWRIQVCKDFARDPSNSLRSLYTLTTAQAEVLAETHWYLNLPGIKLVEDHVAKILSTHVGSLSLINVRSLTEAAATNLAKHQGPLFMTLDEFPQAVQIILSTHPSLAKSITCCTGEESVAIEWIKNADVGEDEYDVDESDDDDEDDDEYEGDE